MAAGNRLPARCGVLWSIAARSNGGWKTKCRRSPRAVPLAQSAASRIIETIRAGTLREKCRQWPKLSDNGHPDKLRRPLTLLWSGLLEPDSRIGRGSTVPGESGTARIGEPTHKCRCRGIGREQLQRRVNAAHDGWTNRGGTAGYLNWRARLSPSLETATLQTSRPTFPVAEISVRSAFM